MNYFEIFGFEPSYNLDESDLLKRYFSLQKKNQRQENLLSILNTSFEIIKDPLKRAEYLLSLQKPNDAKKIPENVTIEMFAIREKFSEIDSLKEREKFLKNLKDKKNDLLNQMHNVDLEKFSEIFCFAKFLGSFIKQVEEDVEYRN